MRVVVVPLSLIGCHETPPDFVREIAVMREIPVIIAVVEYHPAQTTAECELRSSTALRTVTAEPDVMTLARLPEGMSASRYESSP